MIKQKVANLFKPGSRMIQRAMGKDTAKTEMTGLQSTHPDTALFLVRSTDRALAPQRMDAECRSLSIRATIRSHRGLMWVTVDTHHQLSLLLSLTNPSRILWNISNSEQHLDLASRSIQTNPLNILSAIESELGDNGRSICTRCIHCKKNSLKTISLPPADKRRCATYCHTCRAITPTEQDTQHYDNPPFPAHILERKRIPPEAGESLRQPVTMDLLQKHIRNIKPGTAPGDDGMLTDLWRDAPPALLEVLLSSINDALSSGRIPDTWREGTVRFLLKKDPSSLLSNWRPVCLLATAYKIYASIINHRLKTIVERHRLLNPSQEGFRNRRCTQRQIERVTMLLAKARNDKMAVHFTLYDFTNAFNSCDHECMLKTLQWLGIPDIDLIRDMLHASTFASRNNIGTTAPIHLTRGVKQGAVESPLIFNLFINVLLDYLEDANVGVSLAPGTKSCTAGFADDLATIVAAHSHQETWNILYLAYPYHVSYCVLTRYKNCILRIHIMYLIVSCTLCTTHNFKIQILNTQQHTESTHIVQIHNIQQQDTANKTQF
jgi:hypothetical protein